MRRFDEVSYKRIADRLGISVSMVEKYMSRALAHLRKRIAQAEWDGDQPADQRHDR